MASVCSTAMSLAWESGKLYLYSVEQLWHGLKVKLEFTNAIGLLETENNVQGFRYFAFISTGRPEIAYLRETVDNLMTTVTEEVRKRLGKSTSPGSVP